MPAMASFSPPAPAAPRCAAAAVREPPARAAPRCAAPVGRRRGGGAVGWRRERRLLKELNLASGEAAEARLIRRFVAASGQHAALAALSRLLGASSRFALPLYAEISETWWYKWTSSDAANIAALLELNGSSAELETLIADSILHLESTSSAFAVFYCDLISAFSSRGLNHKAMEFYAQLKSTPLSGRKEYEAMLKSLCSIGFAAEAEEMLKNMASSGHRPHPFHFGMVARSYGKSGSFLEMEGVLASMSDAGFCLDTDVANVILSCYGSHGKLSMMLSWLQKMQASGIELNVIIYNVVLNSCPTLASMVQELDSSLPLSLQDLGNRLETNSPCPAEAKIVQELLVSSSALAKAMKWSEEEVKLNLHGFHVIASYMAILQWVEVMRGKLEGEMNGKLPSDVCIVCGIGKHSVVRGESKVKELVREVLYRMKSPMRLDRRNSGRLVATGKTVKEWLSYKGDQEEWRSIISK